MTARDDDPMRQRAKDVFNSLERERGVFHHNDKEEMISRYTVALRAERNRALEECKADSLLKLEDGGLYIIRTYQPHRWMLVGAEAAAFRERRIMGIIAKQGDSIRKWDKQRLIVTLEYLISKKP